MTTGQAEKDDVLADYAAFLKALLPQAQGFVCHDSRGHVFWTEAPPEGSPAVTDEYRAVLLKVLRMEELPPEGARLKLGPHVAYIAQLAGDGERALGALTVLVDRSAATMPYAFVIDVLAPALRSLCRELSLRYRVLDAQRKLKVQAAEERLLHKVEKLLHERQPCETALQQILALCREHLDVAGAWLVIPDKHIAITAGDGIDAAQARDDCEAVLARPRQPGDDNTWVNRRDAMLWLGIEAPDGSLQGVFALYGWQKSPFSERRLARVVRYVGSHIDSLLDRAYDALTGLLSWAVFELELAGAPPDGEAVVMCMDVDRLHIINETFGREAGDEVLKRFAAVLHELLPGRPLTRVTGDQFVALLTGTGMGEARRIGEEICARFREHSYVRGDQTHRPTVSVGIAPLGHGEEAGAEMAGARVALQAAKDRGRARVEVYESADASICRRFDDIQLVGYVRNAIENNRLALVTQPLVPLKPRRMAHYHEVLVRIVDDAGQHVPPGDFMSAAERYQLMEELDRWVVSTTLDLLARRGPHLHGRVARFAINLSGQSLGSDAFLPFVEDQISRSGIPPDLITFEITESVAVARMQQAQAFMQALKSLGCRFSLDDFGTGLSSFAYLKLFPVDTLKIDGSFVRDVTTNVVSQSVVAAIAEVARVMQLETVAEYVQDQASVELLRSLNITYAQGYFVGETALLEERIACLEETTRTRRGRPAGKSA